MGFARALVSSTRYETHGLGTGAGTTITAGSTANTKGSFVTLGIAGFSYDGLHLAITGLGGGGGSRFRIDLAVNTGGSDQVIAGDIYFDPMPLSTYYDTQKTIFLPVAVPNGATIAARSQATTASVTCSVSVLGFCGDAKATKGFRGLFAATDFTNADPTNTITLSGTTQTGWVQIQAATAQRIAGLYLILDSLGNSSLTTASATFEIGIGASGLEHTTGIIVPAQLGVAPIDQVHGPYPCDIAAGERLVVRAQCDVADTNAIGAVLYGLAA